MLIFFSQIEIIAKFKYFLNSHEQSETNFFWLAYDNNSGCMRQRPP